MLNGSPDLTALLTRRYRQRLVAFALLGVALGFFPPAFGVGDQIGAALWAVIAFGFAIWSGALSLWRRKWPPAPPQWAFCAPIAILGAGE